MAEPRFWTAWRLERLRRWRATGVSTRLIAQRFGVSPAVVRLAAARHGLTTAQTGARRALPVVDRYDPAAVEAAIQALIPHSPV